MANRRMFSLDVVDTDMFLEMPATSQSLYFHLGMRADDDGFVSSPKKITKLANCSEDDLRILISKGYVLPFQSGVVVLTHWKKHNYIQRDRYHQTQYQKERLLLELDGDVYRLNDKMDTACIQDVHKMEAEVRLGKDIDNKYIVEHGTTFYPFEEIISYLNQQTGKAYRVSTKKTEALIKARIQEGFTLEDFKRVIDWKVKEWQGTEWEKYLSPDTLFGTKFEKYLNNAPAAPAPVLSVPEEPGINMWDGGENSEFVSV